MDRSALISDSKKHRTVAFGGGRRRICTPNLEPIAQKRSNFDYLENLKTYRFTDMERAYITGMTDPQKDTSDMHIEDKQCHIHDAYKNRKEYLMELF